MDYVLLAIAGAVAGVLGGLLGIGGSSVMLPAMVLILGARRGGREQIHQYQAAAMIVNFLLILPSVLAHWKNRAIWKRVWLGLVTGALVGIVAGVQISYLFDTPKLRMGLRWLVGGFFLYVAGHNAHRLIRGRRSEGLPKARAEVLPLWRSVAVGGPMGFIAGLLGIGGGSLAVPGQQIALRMPLRNAIATSAATIGCIAWLGATLKNAQLGANGSVVESLRLTACLAPTAMIGSYVGGHLTHKLPLRAVRIAFIGLMIFAAWKMMEELFLLALSGLGLM
jgi:hypothetical protein